MRNYKIVKKEESPVIQLSKVNLNNGFILVTSDSESVGIIVFDDQREEFLFIDSFTNSFLDGVNCGYHRIQLEELMEDLKNDFADPVEFIFMPIEQ